MKRISLLGVIVGGITDIGLTTVLTFPVLAYAFASGGILSLPKAQQQSALIALLHANLALYATSFMIGALCSVLRATLRHGSRSATRCSMAHSHHSYALALSCTRLLPGNLVDRSGSQLSASR